MEVVHEGQEEAPQPVLLMPAAEDSAQPPQNLAILADSSSADGGGALPPSNENLTLLAHHSAEAKHYHHPPVYTTLSGPFPGMFMHSVPTLAMPHGHPTQLVALDTPGAALHRPTAAFGPAPAFLPQQPQQQFALRGSAEMPMGNQVYVPSVDTFQIPPPPGLGVPPRVSGLTRELQIPSGYKLVMVPTFDDDEHAQQQHAHAQMPTRFGMGRGHVEPLPAAAVAAQVLEKRSHIDITPAMSRAKVRRLQQNESLLELFHKGFTMTEIAHCLGLHYSTILRRLKELGEIKRTMREEELLLKPPAEIPGAAGANESECAAAPSQPGTEAGEPAAGEVRAAAEHDADAEEPEEPEPKRHRVENDDSSDAAVEHAGSEHAQ